MADLMRGKEMKKQILALLLTMMSHAAEARYWSGNEIYRWLNSPSEVGAARMYIMGIADAEELSHLFAIAQQENVTGEQLANVVRQFLKNNPKNRHTEAAMLVRLGLIESWPCATNN